VRGAGRIREEDIALVRERTNIADVVGDQVTLRPAGGGSLKGLCPFHDEKTPSFNVRPQVGAYHCFGCNVGGDAIDFVMKIDHLSFAEAVERLAARAGVQLRYVEGGATRRNQVGQRTRLVEAHRAAAEYYAEQLGSPEAIDGRRFLSERGFDAAAASQFGVGYAPAAWDCLVRHLRGRGFADQELLLAGLAREGQRGPIDRFRGRLVWPIKDVTGDVIGFGARRLREDDNAPKYLNTPETPIYKKSQVLYGVDLAKREIARRRQAVVVEGYTDVMACHLAGVPTAIATCGTAFGGEHIKVLRRLLMDQDEFRGEVIFTFDGDEAGRKAALKAFDDDQKFVTQTFVAVEPDGLDPCDLRLKKGDSAVRELVARRVPLFEFAIRNRLEQHNLDTTEGRLAALDAVAPIVAQIRDRGLRQRYAVNVDRWLGMLDEQFVVRRIAEHGGPREAGGAAARPRPRDQRRVDLADPAVQAEREVLKIVLQHPALVGAAFDAVEQEVFTAPPYAAVRAAVLAAGGAASGRSGEGWVAAVRERCPDDMVRSLVLALAVEPVPTTGDPDSRYATTLLARLEELHATRRVTEMKSRLQRINPVEQAGDYNKLFGDLVALEQHLRALRERAIGDL
jgi:DNA primase